MLRITISVHNNLYIWILVDFLMDEDKLQDLYAQKNDLEGEILKEKIEVAKKEGRVVSSVESLKCNKHLNSKFVVAEEGIPGSPRQGNIYFCGECDKDDVLKKSPRSEAYDCPNCGIVVGKFSKRPYRSSEASWRSLVGREGEHYHCTVCETKIGHDYWKFS